MQQKKKKIEKELLNMCNHSFTQLTLKPKPGFITEWKNCIHWDKFIRGNMPYVALFRLIGGKTGKKIKKKNMQRGEKRSSKRTIRNKQ